MEARIFGIPYPLEPGWLNMFGRIEISPVLADQLRSKLEYAVQNRLNGWAWAEEGLKSLRRAKIIDRSVELYLSGGLYESTEWAKAMRAVHNLNQCACYLCQCKTQFFEVKHRVVVPALMLDYDNLVPLCPTCAPKWQSKCDYRQKNRRKADKNSLPKRSVQAQRIGFLASTFYAQV
jgi:hypothetical protein